MLTNESLEWVKDNHLLTHCRKDQFMAKAGDTVEFDRATFIEPYTGFYPFKKIFTFGAFSYSHSCDLHHLHFKVGRYCSIASRVSHMGFSHPTQYISTSPFTYDRSESFVSLFIQDHSPEYANLFPATQKPVPIVKNDVWIGAGAILANGITIDNGAIIASESVVTKNVPAFEIWGGNPARFIKKRFDDYVVDVFTNLEWWKYKFTDFVGMPVNDPFQFASLF